MQAMSDQSSDYGTDAEVEQEPTPKGKGKQKSALPASKKTVKGKANKKTKKLREPKAPAILPQSQAAKKSTLLLSDVCTVACL